MNKTHSAAGPQTRWQRLASVARSEGIRGLLARLNERRKHYFTLAYHHLLVYEMDPGADLPECPLDVQVVQVRLEDAQAIRELARIYRVPTSEEALRARLVNDDLCYIGRVDGEMVGYVWICYCGNVQEYGQTILRLKADEVYDHDVYVVPKFRGKNIYPVIKVLAARELVQKHGKKRMLSYVWRTNGSSLRASSKLGEYNIGWIGHVKLLGRRYPFRLRRRPRLLSQMLPNHPSSGG